jgi:hypothetical protein
VAVATAAPPQAIAGVSPSHEREIETEFPSIAAVAPGRILGGLMNCLPVGTGIVKLSYLIFGLPLAPLGVIGYLQLKVTGQRYTVTNRSVSVRGAMTGAVVKQVALKDVASVDVDVLGGQEFFRAGDVVLRNAGGDEILRCAGVPQPERFKHVIIEARDARMQSDEALAAINKRR